MFAWILVQDLLCYCLAHSLFATYCMIKRGGVRMGGLTKEPATGLHAVRTRFVVCMFENAVHVEPLTCRPLTVHGTSVGRSRM